MSGDYLLELNEVSRFYNDRGVTTPGIKDITFGVKRNEVVSLVGPSGSGKTTILKIIAGLLQPDSGKVLRHHSKVGYVSQTSSLLPFRDVWHNIALPFELQNRVPDVEQINNILAALGLTEFKTFCPYQLSGGMRQKVAIARALITHPDLLLLDEPFSALDEFSREKLNLELLRVKDQFGVSIVYVTHKIEEAVLLSDRILILTSAPGRIREEIKVNLKTRDQNTQAQLEFFNHVQGVRKSLAL